MEPVHVDGCRSWLRWPGGAAWYASCCGEAEVQVMQQVVGVGVVDKFEEEVQGLGLDWLVPPQFRDVVRDVRDGEVVFVVHEEQDVRDDGLAPCQNMTA